MPRVALPCLASLVLLLVASCDFERSQHQDSCSDEKKCTDGKYCGPDGFCLDPDAGSNDEKRDSGPSGKSDGGSGKDAATEPCNDKEPASECYEGAAETKDVGVCRAGQHMCVRGTFSDCLGQLLPSDEMCNGKDDDCDGQTDEITMGDCDTKLLGICGPGALVCRGQYPVCESIERAVNEQCNGKDDDCDGELDEVTSSVSCYPAGEIGCTLGDDGFYTCAGLCKAGQESCDGGKASCAGMTTPATEVCTGGGTAIASDENCDGKIDEGCPCNTGDTRACYSGPPGTVNKGECKPGEQTCVDKKWGGECADEVTSQPETCENPNEDNDCNGTKDDVPELGNSCINDGAYGICRPGTKKCAGDPEPLCVSDEEPQEELCDDINQDCDRNDDPSNGFDLTTDNQNCGKCGEVCDDREGTCCNAGCTKFEEFEEDRQNCGSCGKHCGNNQFCCQGGCTTVYLGGGGPQLPGPGPDFEKLCQCEERCGDGTSCCGEKCVNLEKDANNCGACGRNCTNILGAVGRCVDGDCAPLL